MERQGGKGPPDEYPDRDEGPMGNWTRGHLGCTTAKSGVHIL